MIVLGVFLKEAIWTVRYFIFAWILYVFAYLIVVAVVVSAWSG